MKRDQKETTIFALRLGDDVFVGRTTARRISTVCYSHRRGEHEQTADVFGVSIRRPELYILDRITAHSTVAYRYVVAWVHVFEEAGYHILNLGDVRRHAADLHPETVVIVDEIMETPLEEHLAQCHCAKYTDADSPPSQGKPQVHNKPVSDPVTAKLTIRLSEEEKQKFDQAARSLRLTHRELLQYLIQFSPEEDLFVSLLLKNHDNKSDRLKKRIKELEATVSAQREKLAKQADVYKNYVAMVRQGITEFMDYFTSTSTYPLALEVDWYDEYMRSCQTDFVYPAEAGIAMVRPIAILRGHGRTPPLFVLAVTVNGECIKLRYYPKQQYVGLFPTDHRFGVRGSAWLMGWQCAEENVMQLMFALPLQIRAEYNNPMDPHERLEKITEDFLREVE